MRIKIFLLLFLSSYAGYSQSLLDISCHCDFDSIKIIGLYDMELLLTDHFCEIIDNNERLTNIFSKCHGIDSLFIECKNAVPFLSNHKAAESLNSDSIVCDFEQSYTISLYNKGTRQCEFEIWYDTDYCFFTSQMHIFISHLARVMRYYHNEYKKHLIYRKSIPKKVKRYYNLILDNSVVFGDQWNTINNTTEDVFSLSDKYSLLFAQVMIRQRLLVPSPDIKSLLISEKITMEDLLYFSSFLPQEEQDTVKKWILELHN